MIVIDANILIYAYNEAAVQHPKARKWVETVFSGAEPVGLPWQTITAFLRLTTNPRLPVGRRKPEEAALIVDGWMQQPNVHLLAPSDDHWLVLRHTVISGQASGALVSDAEIAALTIASGGVLFTVDRDFARFPGLRWENPLQ